MKKKITGVLLYLFVSVLTYSAPKYVFMFIGDGMAASQRQMAEYYVQETTGDKDYSLLINRLPVAGINTTHSMDSLVTDSAAAGTALATGYKTDNGMISVLPDGKKLDSIVDVAEKSGMKTGLISTTRLTHATPAVFASNNMSRDNESDIAEDFLESNVDFFAGGGYRYFISQDKSGSKRKDDRDISKEFHKLGYNVFIGEDSSDEFMNLKASKDQKVFAAFTKSHMPYEVDRVNSGSKVPSLADMTEKGIEVLSKNRKGFFMMVEAGRIDHAAHANDAASVINDTLAFDKAVKKAYDFYQKHPKDTLILVVGDHETGGLGMGYGKNYFLNLKSLQDVKISVDDTLQKAYKGDREAYFKFIEEKMGLNNLTEKEKSLIEKSMDIEDSGVDVGKTYGGYTPTAIAVAHVMDMRANVMFTTFAHSATQIPLSAVGKKAESFQGFKDNTEIGRILMDIVD
ncbi:alkaline phosphatase [uncultured Ilyobacter sp.]|uniref:alkaline phosphatase n=1 Tax=uncultured Ilyobacter sp. TaxID=544433 RepID=UPI002AA6F284|nr:alkaline phosphatase [uncultured Ilyobacter sp.]